MKKKGIPRSEQVQILTVLRTLFQTSDYMARKAKQLVGILSTPNPKPPKLVDLINESDDMSGKKNFVSIRQGEKRVQQLFSPCLQNPIPKIMTQRQLFD